MQWPLLLSGLALGLAAMPHCAVMCATPCAAVTRQGHASSASFQLGRLASYAIAGALVAYSVSNLGTWRSSVPALRPLWTLVHLACLCLGLWWLFSGRQAAWLRRDAGVPVQVGGIGRDMRRAGLAGLAWVAWPCAALQGALLLAALANTPLAGAMVMGAFALASMPGLLAAPWALRRWQIWRGRSLRPQALAMAAFRFAGAGMVITSTWALRHDLLERLPGWCA